MGDWGSCPAPGHAGHHGGHHHPTLPPAITIRVTCSVPCLITCQVLRFQAWLCQRMQALWAGGVSAANRASWGLDSTLSVYLTSLLLQGPACVWTLLFPSLEHVNAHCQWSDWTVPSASSGSSELGLGTLTEVCTAGFVGSRRLKPQGSAGVCGHHHCIFWERGLVLSSDSHKGLGPEKAGVGLSGCTESSRRRCSEGLSPEVGPHLRPQMHRRWALHPIYRIGTPGPHSK